MAKAVALSDGLDLLRVVGGVLGKAMYEGVLLDAPLAPTMLARLQGRRPALDDLAAIDPVLHQNLVYLKRLACACLPNPPAIIYADISWAFGSPPY